MDNPFLLGATLAFVGLTDIAMANLLRERFSARIRTLLSVMGAFFILAGLAVIVLNLRSAP